MTKQSLGCGRPSEASRDPRVWKATLWIPYGIPCGYPMGYHVEYPRGYPREYPRGYPMEYPRGYIVET